MNVTDSQKFYMLDPLPDSGLFRYAFLVAFLLELGLIVGVAFWPHRLTKPQVVRPATIAVQLVKLPTPVVPKPKPVPKLPVIHKLEPKPIVTKTPAHHAVQLPPVKPKVLPKLKPVLRPPKVVPPTSTPSPMLRASAMSRYVGMIRPMIQENLRVPALLRIMGLSGQATIKFRLSPMGKIIWARVSVPSSVDAVNSAALAAVERGHYPIFLKHMPHRDTTFEITVHISGNGS